MRVRPSEMRSEKEWPASAIMAADRPEMPANSLKKARTKLTIAPTSVILDASSSNSAFLRSERRMVCRCSEAHPMIKCTNTGRTTCTWAHRNGRNGSATWPISSRELAESSAERLLPTT